MVGLVLLVLLLQTTIELMLSFCAGEATDAGFVAQLLQGLSQVDQPGEADVAPLLKMSIAVERSELALYTLYATAPPSLFRAVVRGRGGALSWERVRLATDVEEDTTRGDVASAQLEEGKALSSLTEFYVGRLLLPGRFPPRLLAAACHALLSAGGEAACVGERVRRGMEARVFELEQESSENREECERSLGESMLHFCLGRLAEPEELLAIAHVSYGEDVASLLLTRSGLTLLPLPSAPPTAEMGGMLLEAANAISSCCMDCTKLADANWGSWLTSAHPEAHRAPLAAVEQLLVAAKAVSAREGGGSSGGMNGATGSGEGGGAAVKMAALLNGAPPWSDSAAHLLAMGRWGEAARTAGASTTKLLSCIDSLLGGMGGVGGEHASVRWEPSAWHAMACEAMRGAAEKSHAAHSADERLASAVMAQVSSRTFEARSPTAHLVISHPLATSTPCHTPSLSYSQSLPIGCYLQLPLN